ncbi:MAG: DUF3857 domain-containing protein, partial [Bacteroidota bacterium]
PEYAVLLIPAELRANANAVIRNEEITFEIKSSSETITRVRRAVTIFSDKSYLKELRQYYNSEFTKLGKTKAVIYDAMGQEVQKLGRKDWQDFSDSEGSLYSSSRVRYLPVAYSRYPFTIEFEYSETSQKWPFYPFWTVQRYNTSVEKSTYHVRHSKAYSFRYQLRNSDVQAEEITEDDTQVTRWTFEQLPAIAQEAYSPPMSEVLPCIILTPQQFWLGEQTGNMTSWESYGLFMNRLNAQADNMSDQMVQEVKNMTQDAETDKEKIAILYRYLQENMRYVSVQLGVGGWKSFDAKYVEENKYGDCKALTWFMKAMLDKVGITSYPTLVQAGDIYYEVEDSFISPRFNHVFLYVPSEKYWLECTSNYNPVNYLGDWTANRNVLVLTEKGGQLQKSPNYTGRNNLEQHKARIRIAPEGSASIENTVLLTGPSQDVHRAYKNRKGEEEIRDWFVSERLDNLPSVRLQELKIHCDADYPTTTVSYKLEVARYASKAGKRIFLPINCLNVMGSVPPVDDDRKHPIVVRNSYLEKNNFVIDLPEGYAVESMPKEEILIETPYGRYQLKVRKKGERQIECERKLNIQSVNLPATEYNDFRKFYKQVAKMDKAKIVLVKQKT